MLVGTGDMAVVDAVLPVFVHALMVPGRQVCFVQTVGLHVTGIICKYVCETLQVRVGQGARAALHTKVHA